MTEFKRTWYYIVDRTTGQIITDVAISGKDSYIKRLEAVKFIQFPTTAEMRNNLVLVNVGQYNPSIPRQKTLPPNKIKGLTINEVYDEYEFRKYGKRVGRWK
jgi:hypothetical protein